MKKVTGKRDKKETLSKRDKPAASNVEDLKLVGIHFVVDGLIQLLIYKKIKRFFFKFITYKS